MGWVGLGLDGLGWMGWVGWVGWVGLGWLSWVAEASDYDSKGNKKEIQKKTDLGLAGKNWECELNTFDEERV